MNGKNLKAKFSGLIFEIYDYNIVDEIKTAKVPLMNGKFTTVELGRTTSVITLRGKVPETNIGTILGAMRGFLGKTGIQLVLDYAAFNEAVLEKLSVTSLSDNGFALFELVFRG